MESKINNIQGITITPLKQINHPNGNVYHGLKCTESSFTVFGEAYFTTIHKGDLKGWKKHTEMVMNLVVPVGEVDFYFYDEHEKKTALIKAGKDNYLRITVQPGIWMAFEGKAEELNLVLNIASIQHDPEEALNVEIDAFPLHGISEV
ncbi:dTDP-4-dehydrorhamnose 3,5-epimerase [Thalassolituus oleivorans]|uniref:dTDP-4-dehydrorhamnose 3,5-epimerase n=1 Tax=Thalassolituus oleivorans TaxID=187493 RepID=UPI0023F281A3|nr:dTDP-4-dehydrorhamnose 3,5-epimerase [Thalassolituus oleivorans]